jgi:hypothetical protein
MDGDVRANISNGLADEPGHDSLDRALPRGPCRESHVAFPMARCSAQLRKLSNPVRLEPALRCEPMNPDAPVTKTILNPTL